MSWPESQVQATNLPPPKSWKDFRDGCLSTYAGGHHDDGHLGAFQHGMKTVFCLLESEFPPAEDCKAVPLYKAAVEAMVQWFDAENQNLGSFHEKMDLCAYAEMLATLRECPVWCSQLVNPTRTPQCRDRRTKMSEYFVVAESFAAPFFSDRSEGFIEGEANRMVPEDALRHYAANYKHPCGLYSAALYADANAFHRGDRPLAKWLCNREIAKRAAAIKIQDPKGGDLLPCDPAVPG